MFFALCVDTINRCYPPVDVLHVFLLRGARL